MDQANISPTFNTKCLNNRQFELVETKSLIKQFQRMASSTSSTSLTACSVNHLALYSRNDFIVMTSRTEIISIITMNSVLPQVVDIANCFRYPLRHELIKVISDLTESNCIALFNTDNGCAIEIIPLTNIIHRSHKGHTIRFETRLIDIQRVGNEEDYYIVLDDKHYIHLLKDWKPLMTYKTKASLIKVNSALNILIAIDSTNLNTITIYKDIKYQCYTKPFNAMMAQRRNSSVVLMESFSNYIVLIGNDSSIYFALIDNDNMTIVENSIVVNTIHKIKDCKDIFCVFNEIEKLLFVFDRSSCICELFSFENSSNSNNKGNRESKVNITKVAEVDLCSGIIGAAVNNSVYVNKETVKFILLVLTENGTLMQYNNKVNSIANSIRKNSGLIDNKFLDKSNTSSFNDANNNMLNDDSMENKQLQTIDSMLKCNSDTIKKIFNDIQSIISNSLDRSIQYTSFISLNSMQIKESTAMLSSIKTQINTFAQLLQREILSHSLLDNKAIELILPSDKIRSLYNQTINNLNAIRNNLQLTCNSIKDNEKLNNDLNTIDSNANKLYNKLQMFNKFNSDRANIAITANKTDVFISYMKKFEERYRQLIDVYNNTIHPKYNLLRKEYTILQINATSKTQITNNDFPYREINKSEPEIGTMILKNIKPKKTFVDKSKCRELDDIINASIIDRKNSNAKDEADKKMCNVLKKWLDIKDKLKQHQYELKEEEMNSLREMKENMKEKEVMKTEEIDLIKPKQITIKANKDDEENAEDENNQTPIHANVIVNHTEDRIKKDSNLLKEQVKEEEWISNTKSYNPLQKDYNFPVIKEECNNTNTNTQTNNDNNQKHPIEGDISQYIPKSFESNPLLVISKPQSQISNLALNINLNPFATSKDNHIQSIPNPFQIPHNPNPFNVLINPFDFNPNNNQHQLKMSTEPENNTLLLNQSFGTNQPFSTKQTDLLIKNESFLNNSISPSKELALLNSKVSPIPIIK